MHLGLFNHLFFASSVFSRLKNLFNMKLICQPRILTSALYYMLLGGDFGAFFVLSIRYICLSSYVLTWRRALFIVIFVRSLAIFYAFGFFPSFSRLFALFLLFFAPFCVFLIVYVAFRIPFDFYFAVLPLPMPFCHEKASHILVKNGKIWQSAGDEVLTNSDACVIIFIRKQRRRRQIVSHNRALSTALNFAPLGVELLPRTVLNCCPARR